MRSSVLSPPDDTEWVLKQLIYLKKEEENIISSCDLSKITSTFRRSMARHVDFPVFFLGVITIRSASEPMNKRIAGDKHNLRLSPSSFAMMALQPLWPNLLLSDNLLKHFIYDCLKSRWFIMKKYFSMEIISCCCLCLCQSISQGNSGKGSERVFGRPCRGNYRMVSENWSAEEQK